MYLESDGAVSRVQETGGLKQVFRSKGNAICVFLLLCFTAFIGRIGWEWAIMTAELEPAQMAAEMLPLPAGETRVPEARPTSFPEACNVLLAQASQSAGAPSGQQDETSVVWVGGAEGYTNQILSMLDVYRSIQPRTLVMAPMRTEHGYPGVDPPQCLSDVLELENAVCLHPSKSTPEDDRDEVVKSRNCSFDARETGALKGEKTLGDHYLYWRLRYLESWHRLPKVAFSSSSPKFNCIFSRSWSSASWDLWPSRLKIKAAYVELFQRMRESYFGSAPYLAVHWRRGDQLVTKCRVKVDTSANCGSAADLRSFINKKLGGRPWQVYVATNEQDNATLAQLREFGYRLQSDSGCDFNSLEAFFADVFLLGCASEVLLPGFHFDTGKSSVQYLIHRFRQHHVNRNDVCGESLRVLDAVNCGNFVAESCVEQHDRKLQFIPENRHHYPAAAASHLEGAKKTAPIRFLNPEKVDINFVLGGRNLTDAPLIWHFAGPLKNNFDERGDSFMDVMLKKLWNLDPEWRPEPAAVANCSAWEAAAMTPGNCSPGTEVVDCRSGWLAVC
ncbi:unnamed protein product [Symbiodinium natans]|uniref:Uncharacterized protein n=1 Tax=Symbiodinium natans TaxID=878477 RepID=A0A812MJE5_9DINO|nr:unnamed protein product [Symbiodinium natans]